MEESCSPYHIVPAKMETREDVPKEHFLAVSAASQVETEEEVISFDQQQESNVYKGKLDQLHVSIS